MTEEHAFRHEAMNTEFEVVIAQKDVSPALARQAAAAVFAEIDRLEEELSRFKPTSEVWRLSLLKAGESTGVDFAVWDCLCLAKAVHAETAGAFDVTLGPMMHLWRTADGARRVPFPEELSSARQRMGMERFELVAEGLRIRVLADQMLFDLGAIGKGYALDQAVRILEEQGIRSAFLSAGESTLLGLGEQGWPVRLHLDDSEQEILLTDSALSCSGFAVQGAHLMNPRSLEPVPISGQRCYVQAPTAALSDALSTAFLVMGDEEVADFCDRHPEVKRLKGPTV